MYPRNRSDGIRVALYGDVNRPTVRRKKKEISMIRTNAVMKLLTTVVLTMATAFAQSSDRLPVTDAEKIADALRAGPAFTARTRLCSIGHPCLEVNTGLFAEDRTNGPVSRLFLDIRTMRSTPH
jgi:hypothetical protein